MNRERFIFSILIIVAIPMITNKHIVEVLTEAVIVVGIYNILSILIEAKWK